jgi:O-antigen ligase
MLFTHFLTEPLYKFRVANQTDLENLKRYLSLILFTLFSFMSIANLWKKHLLFFILGVIFTLFTRILLKEIREKKEIIIFEKILFLYCFWLIFSGTVHYFILKTAAPSFISVSRQSMNWGLLNIIVLTQHYFLFPLLFLEAIYLLYSLKYKDLFPIFIIIFPSLVIALYQGLVDINFLNIPAFAKSYRASGLWTDANGLGIVTFLLFSPCMLAVFEIPGLLKKMLFFLLSILIFCSLNLSGSRSGILGVFISIIILLSIGFFSNYKYIVRSRLYKYLIIVFTIVILGLSLARVFPLNTVLMKRISDSFKNIKEYGILNPIKESGRLELWSEAWRLTILSPLSGWGPGGFINNLQNIRHRNDESLTLVMDNACNHYLQTTSELGVLGAFFEVLLQFIPLWIVFKARKRIQESEEKWLVIVLFANMLAMLFIYLFGVHTFQSPVLWIYIIQLALLFNTALKYGNILNQLNMKIVWRTFIVLTIFFIAGTYKTTFGSEGYKAMQEAPWWSLKYFKKNCYGYEEWGEDVVCWCKKNAFLRIPIRSKSLPRKIKLTFAAKHPDIQSKPVVVKFGGKSGVKYEVVVNDDSWHMLEFPVTEDNIFTIITTPNKPHQKYFILSLDVSRTWIPKEWGINLRDGTKDTRELGVVLLLSSLYSQLGLI